jgi:hypothetical protein
MQRGQGERFPWPPVFLVSTLFSYAVKIVILNSASVYMPGSINANFLVLINLNNSAILNDKCYGAKPD